MCSSDLLFTYLLTYLFIYLWLCWVFVSVRGLSLVAAGGGHSSSRCTGLSPSRPLLSRSTGSRRAGSAAVAHGPSCSTACGILLDQGSNPCPLHWQADSQPLHHQGSPGRQILNHCAPTGKSLLIILNSQLLALVIFFNYCFLFHCFLFFIIFPFYLLWIYFAHIVRWKLRSLFVCFFVFFVFNVYLFIYLVAPDLCCGRQLP